MKPEYTVCTSACTEGRNSAKYLRYLEFITIASLLGGASSGLFGPGETNKSGHGISGRGTNKRQTQSGEGNAHSNGREGPTGHTGTHVHFH